MRIKPTKILLLGLAGIGLLLLPRRSSKQAPMIDNQASKPVTDTSADNQAPPSD